MNIEPRKEVIVTSVYCYTVYPGRRPQWHLLCNSGGFYFQETEWRWTWRRRRRRTLLRKNVLAAARRSLRGEQLLGVLQYKVRITVQRLASAGFTELTLQNNRPTFTTFRSDSATIKCYRGKMDWNLAVDIAGGKEAEGVWEHGVEENIWT